MSAYVPVVWAGGTVVHFEEARFEPLPGGAKGTADLAIQPLGEIANAAAHRAFDRSWLLTSEPMRLL